jgi:signal transduction histidine kinase
MPASAGFVFFAIAGAIPVTVALALVRARLRALEAAFAGVRLDLAARDDALRAADRSRRQMLADVSHELRTPLTAMRGYLETLQMADLDLDAVTRARSTHACSPSSGCSST